MSIDFIRPEVDELRPRISVIGVGGAGGNAIANMMQADVQGVDFVVANTDAAQLYSRLVPGGRARRQAARIRRSTPSLSGFVLLLALDRAPVDTPHHQVLFAEDYDAEFDAVFGRRGRARPV